MTQIGFDVDGVLRQLTEYGIKTYFLKYPEHKKYFIGMNSWELTDWFSNVDASTCCKQFMFDESPTSRYVFENAPIYDDVKSWNNNIYKRLKDKINDGEILIVTSQKTSWAKIATINWLDKNDIKYDALIFSNKKYHLNIDYFIDDKPKTCELFDSIHLSNTAVLRSHLWNKKSTHYLRVNTITEFVDKIIFSEQYKKGEIQI